MQQSEFPSFNMRAVEVAAKTYRKQVPDALLVWHIVLGDHATGWDACIVVAHVQDCLQHLLTHQGDKFASQVDIVAE